MGFLLHQVLKQMALRQMARRMQSRRLKQQRRTLTKSRNLRRKVKTRMKRASRRKTFLAPCSTVSVGNRCCSPKPLLPRKNFLDSREGL